MLYFGAEEDSIEEIDALDGFKLSTPTLDAFGYEGLICQVTRSGLTTSDASVSWSAAGASENVTVAAHDGQHCVMGLAGGQIVLLTLASGGIANVQYAFPVLYTHDADRDASGLWICHMKLHV